MNKALCILSIVVFIIALNLVGCVEIPEDAKPLTLVASSKTGTVSSQAARISFSVGVFNDPDLLPDRGKSWGTSNVPESLTITIAEKIVLADGTIYQKKLIEYYSGQNFSVDFYRPATYVVSADSRTGFGISGKEPNVEPWIGKSVEVVIKEGSGYKSSNFFPGVILVTSYGTAVIQKVVTEVIEGWGSGWASNFVPLDNNPVNNNPSQGNRNIIFSFPVETVAKISNKNFSEPVSIEGYATHVHVVIKYFDTSVVKFLSVTGNNGWMIDSSTISQTGQGLSFSATNSVPNSSKVEAFVISFQPLQVGISGITWPDNMVGCSGDYNGDQAVIQSGNSDTNPPRIVIQN